MRAIIIFILFALALTGCANQDSNKVTLEQVVQAIRSEGIELKLRENTPNTRLNLVKPTIYEIKNPNENLVSLSSFTSSALRKLL